MPSVECEEHVQTLTKWCKTHNKKKNSFFGLQDCPLYFLLWPELPVLTPDASREPLEEVIERCELCGECYNPDSLPVAGCPQVGVTKVVKEELKDAAEAKFNISKQTCRSKYHVTFAPCIPVESDISVRNVSSEKEEEKAEENTIIVEKVNEIVSTNLSNSESAELSAEEEGDHNSEDEDSMNMKKKNLPFKKKKN